MHFQLKGTCHDKKLFVNLPVKDLKRSMSFFKELGFQFNAQFTDDATACMIIADDIYAMLLTHAKFKTFTKKEIADTTRFTEGLTALSFENKAKVDDLVETALKAGAIESGELQDYVHVRPELRRPRRSYLGDLLMDPNHIQKT
jgi:predicted lactoylglutathione lyase